MKRTMRLLLGVALLLGPLGLRAQDGWRGGGNYWISGVGYSLDDSNGQATAVTSDPGLEGSIYLPTELAVVRDSVGKLFGNSLTPAYRFRVVAVAEDAFKGQTGITRVSIGRNVQTIKTGAFTGCSGLEQVVLRSESYFTEAEENAFDSLMTSVTLIAPSGYNLKPGWSTFKHSSTKRVVEFGSQTGHTAFHAFLNDQPFTSGDEVKEGDVVKIIYYSEDVNRFRIAATGQYSTSDLGALLNGTPLIDDPSNTSIDGETGAITRTVTVEADTSYRLEAACQPLSRKISYNAVKSTHRVFTNATNTSKELDYVVGGTLTATVDGRGAENGMPVELGAQVTYTADPGAGVTVGEKSYWEVDKWLVDGVEQDATGNTLTQKFDPAKPVQVRFKRNTFGVRLNKINPGSEFTFGAETLSTTATKWFVEGNYQGKIQSSLRLLTVNGSFHFIDNPISLVEDLFIEAVNAATLGITFAQAVEGKGELKVERKVDTSWRVCNNGQGVRIGSTIRVTATPDAGYKLKSLTVCGLQVESGKELIVHDAPALRVFAVFAPVNQQTLILVTEGHGSITVTRGEEKLRNGSKLLPGDRLRITTNTYDYGEYLYPELGLTVNGRPFKPGDEYVVGEGDVLIEQIVGNTHATYLSTRVVGKGMVKATRDTVEYQNGSTLENGDYTIVAVPNDSVSDRLVRLMLNEKRVNTDAIFNVPNNRLPTTNSGSFKVFLDAVFTAKANGRVLVTDVIQGDGYIHVTHNGALVGQGEPVREGQQLVISAVGSNVSGSKSTLKSLTVNGRPWTSGDLYVVPAGSDDVEVVAIFDAANVQTLTYSHAEKGKGTLAVNVNGVEAESPSTITEGNALTFATTVTDPDNDALRAFTINGSDWDPADTYTVGAGEDVTVYAHFAAKDAQILRKISNPGGTLHVTSAGLTVNDFDEVKEGDALEISTRVDDGYELLSLTVGGNPFMGRSYTVGKELEVRVEAVFGAKSTAHKLIVLSSAEGRIEAKQNGVTLESGKEIVDGKDITVEVFPFTGYNFTQWFVQRGSGAMEAVGNANPHTIAGPNTNITVKGSYAPSSSASPLAIAWGVGGEVVVADKEDGTIYKDGDELFGRTIIVKAIPAAGYELSDFVIAGEQYTDAEKEYIVPDGAVVITASFKRIPYKLTIKTSGTQAEQGEMIVERDGTLLTGADSIYYGDLLKISAKPKDGAPAGVVCKKVVVNGALREPDSPTTYRVTNDVTVDGVFGLEDEVLLVLGETNCEVIVMAMREGVSSKIEHSKPLIKGETLTIEVVPSADHKLTQFTLNDVERRDFPLTHVVGDRVDIQAICDPIINPPIRLLTNINDASLGKIEVMRGSLEIFAGEELFLYEELDIEAKPIDSTTRALLAVDGVEVSNPQKGYVVTGTVDVQADFFAEGTIPFSVVENGPGRVAVVRHGIKLAPTVDKLKVGDVLTIKATPDPSVPNAHVSLLKVNGNSAFINGATLTVDDKGVRVIAHFSDRQELVIDSESGGAVKVTRNGVELKSGDTIKEGEKLIITSIPDAGFLRSVLRVAGEDFTSGGTYLVPDGKSVTVMARFIAVGKKKLEIIPSHGGIITVTDEEGKTNYPSGTELLEGQKIIVKAEAYPGNTLTKFSVGDTVSTTDPITYVVKSTDGAVFVKAEFDREGFDWSVATVGDAKDEGEITVKRGTEELQATDKVFYGDDLVIVPSSANLDVVCSALYINGASQGNAASYSHTVRGEVEIKAVFTKPTSGKLLLYTEAKPNEGGIITVMRDSTAIKTGEELEKDQLLEITTKANDGYWFNGLTVEGADRQADGTYKVHDNTYVTAEFIKDSQVKLSVSKLGDGKVAVRVLGGRFYGDGDYIPVGTQLQISAEGNAPSELRALKVNDTIITSGSLYTVKEHMNVNVKAIFALPEAITLITSVKGDGVIKVTADGDEIEEGANVKGKTLTITAEGNAPSVLKRLLVNGTRVVSGYELKVEDGMTEVRVVAEFALETEQWLYITQPAEGGTISVADENGTPLSEGKIPEGVKKLTLSDNPESGYKLYKFTSNQPIEDKAITMPSTGSVEVGAIFHSTSPDCHYLTVEQSGEGTITITDAENNVYKDGDEVTGKTLTVTAVGENSMELKKLTINGDKATSGATHEVKGDVKVFAQFGAEDEQWLYIETPIGGTITVKDQDSNVLSEGPLASSVESFQFESTADSDYELRTYRVNNQNIPGNTYARPAEGSVVVSALFTPVDPSKHYLTIGWAGGGEVVVTDEEDNRMEDGQEVTGKTLSVSAIPATNYAVKSLTVNNEPYTEPFLVGENVSVYAEFGLARTVKVTLLDSESKEVVSGATIAIKHNLSVTFSEEAGLYTAPMADGDYVMQISHPDYEPKDEPITIAGEDLEVEVELTKKAPDTHTLTVVVKDNKKKAMPNVSVTLKNTQGYSNKQSTNKAGEAAFRGLQPGSYTVSLTVKGFKAVNQKVEVKGDASVTITLQPDGSSPIEAVSLAEVTLSPNPATSFIRLNNAESAQSYTIYTLAGARCVGGSLAASTVHEIAVDQLPAGLYLIRLEAKDGVKVLRFAVQR